MLIENNLCEMINGEVYDMSPSPSIVHQRISGRLSTEIRLYIRTHKGKCEVFEAPTDVKLGEKTVVIPDIFVACDRSKFDEQQFNGAPDWVIEIVSPSNAVRDLRDKLFLYSAAGVREYWIIDPTEEKVIVYKFGKPNITAFYKFSDRITAGIFAENDEPFSVCIEELLNE